MRSGPGVPAHAYNPNREDVKAERIRAQIKFIHNKYKTTLGDMKSCLEAMMGKKPGVPKIPVPERWRQKDQQFKDGYRASSWPVWVDYQR